MTSTSADLQQSFNQKKIQKYKNLRQSMREKQMQTHFCIQCNEATSPLIELYYTDDVWFIKQRKYGVAGPIFAPIFLTQIQQQGEHALA